MLMKVSIALIVVGVTLIVVAVTDAPLYWGLIAVACVALFNIGYHLGVQFVGGIADPPHLAHVSGGNGGSKDGDTDDGNEDPGPYRK